MASSPSQKAIRALAAICGLGLFPPMFLIQMFPGHTGWSPGVVLGLFAFGGPSGLLLHFARSGRLSWRAALVLPVVAIAQSASILAAVAAFPHDRAIHMAASIAAAWLVLLGAYALAPTRSRAHAA